MLLDLYKCLTLEEMNILKVANDFTMYSSFSANMFMEYYESFFQVYTLIYRVLNDLLKFFTQTLFIESISDHEPLHND